MQACFTGLSSYVIDKTKIANSPRRRRTLGHSGTLTGTLWASSASIDQNGNVEGVSVDEKPVEERWQEEFNDAGNHWVRKIPQWLGGQDCVEAWLHGFGTLTVRVAEARGILAADRSFLVGNLSASDPYANVKIDGQCQQTEHDPATLHPRWNTNFQFKVRDPGATLLIEVWDYDAIPGNDDDFLGQVEIPVADLAPGVNYTGWLRIQDNDTNDAGGEFDNTEQLGGMKLEIELQIPDPNKLWWVYVTRVPGYFQDPIFNLDELYTPIMSLVEIIWTRFLGPVIFAILDVLTWKNPWHSANRLTAWLLLWRFNNWAMFVLITWLAYWHMQQKDTPNVALKKKRAGDKKKKLSEGKPEVDKVNEDKAGEKKAVTEVHLSSYLLTIASMCPANLQKSLAVWQPLLATLAWVAKFLYEAFTYAPASTFAPILNYILWGLSVLLLVMPSRYLVMIVTIFLFIVITPVFKVLLGLLFYAIRGKPRGIPNIDMYYDRSWDSIHAQEKHKSHHHSKA